MTPKLLRSHLINPTKYESGIGAGFIIFPHSDSNPQGWGTPYSTPGGASIEPGTMGGPNANRKVGYKKGAWKRQRTKYLQASGNIDWVGPWITEQQQQRYIISCNGPNSRYWNPGLTFKYDDAQNFEVYMGGQILSVAPKPVLGAAFGTDTIYHSDGTSVKIKILIVICKNGTAETIYVRPMPSLVTRENLSTAVREEMQRLFDPNDAPKGWTQSNTSPEIEGAYEPEAPWFFNEPGTHAKSMRRVARQWTDDLGIEKTEDLFIEVSMVFTYAGLIGIFSKVDMDPNTHSPSVGTPGQYIVTETMYRKRDTRLVDRYVDPIADDHGQKHNWYEDSVRAQRTVTGSQQVAVDWDPDRGVWVRAWLNFNCWRMGAQYWVIGCDNDFPVDPTFVHPNTGIIRTSLLRPPGQVPQHEDHFESSWIGTFDKVWLICGPQENTPDMKFLVGYGRSSDKGAYFTGIVDPDNPYFYHWDSLDVWLHYLDLRSSVVAGYMYFDSITVEDDETITHMKDKRELSGSNMYDPTDGKWARMWYVSDKTIVGYFESFMGWQRATKNSWPEVDLGTMTAPIKMGTKSYQGAPSTANDNGEYWVPKIDSFFHDMGFARKAGMERERPHQYLLDVEHCYREGCFLSNYKKEWILSYRYKDENTGETVTENKVYPEGDISSVVGGGTKFWPGGLV